MIYVYLVFLFVCNVDILLLGLMCDLKKIIFLFIGSKVKYKMMEWCGIF